MSHQHITRLRTQNQPVSPNHIIQLLAESNAQLSKGLFTMLNQPNQADQDLAGLVLKLQQELDAANERLVKHPYDKIQILKQELNLANEQLEEYKGDSTAREELEYLARCNEDLQGCLNASNTKARGLKQAIETLNANIAGIIKANAQEEAAWRKQIAEMKQHHEQQVAQWADTVQGLLAQREQLEIERDALKKENAELRRVLAETQQPLVGQSPN